MYNAIHIEFSIFIADASGVTDVRIPQNKSKGGFLLRGESREREVTDGFH
jgi:hypothetical protein